MNNNSATAAARWYISQGLFPVPVPPGQKGPVMKNWPAFRCTEAGADAVFSQRGNIGIILTGGLVCIDLDHPIAVSLAAEYLPPTGCVVGRPGNPACHWFYRIEGPPIPNRMLRYTLDGTWHTVLDILSEGKQVLVGPSIHPSGDRYDPKQGIEGDVTAPELLLAVDGLFGAVMGRLRASGLRVGELASLLPASFAPAPHPQRATDAPLRVGDDFNDRGDIRDILARNGWALVRAGDNEHWRRPGKENGSSATLLHGRQFWNFSSSAPHLEANRLYDAFGLLAHLEHGGNFSAASERLRGEGFGPIGSRGDDGTSPPDYSWVGRHGAPAESGAPQEEAFEFPSACLRPPGLIGEIIDFNLLTASHPQPILALAGALALMSTITGNRVRSFPNHATHTNLYVLGLAPTGAGKDHARNINRDLLMAAGGVDYIGSESIGSAAGIITALDKQPVQLMQLDEIADMLTTMKTSTKSPHLYQIGPVLKAVKTSAGRVVKGPALKHEENLKELRFPHLVLYGTSIPDGFWESITSTQVYDGLLSRFLIFEGGYARMKKATDAKPPSCLVQGVEDWLNFGHYGAKPQGAFSKAVQKHSESSPELAPVPHTSEALDRAIGHMDQINERQIEEAKTDPARAAIWSRTAENTNQLALLFTCSRCGAGGPLEVTLPDVDLAIQLSNWMTRRMLSRITTHVSETENERHTKRLLRLIPKEGVYLRDLQRKCQWIKTRDFHDLLGSLVETELISIESVKTGKKGKPPSFVRRVQF